MEKTFKIWQIFFIGLLAGIIGGGAIVWLEMKDANRNFLSQILYELNTLKLEQKIAEDLQQKEKAPAVKNSKSGKLKQSKNEDHTAIPLRADSSATLAETDSSALSVFQNPPDSIQPDSGLSTSENIVVKKDRLIFSTVLKLKAMEGKSSELMQNDSVMEELSGMHTEEDKKEFIVEFWESPINYKGYKMGNNKIVLFGIAAEIENISLFQIEKRVYLKNNDVAYQLDVTYSFEPLKKVTDKTLLARLDY